MGGHLSLVTRKVLIDDDIELVAAVIMQLPEPFLVPPLLLVNVLKIVEKLEVALKIAHDVLHRIKAEGIEFLFV